MTTAPASNGSRPRPAGPAAVGGQVRAAALGTLAAGLVAVLAGWLLGGPDAAAGAAVGFGVVLVFFAVGAVVVNAVATVSPTASLLVALLTYTLEVVLVAVVLAALERSGALDGTVDRVWAGGSVVVATLGWTLAHLRSATRSRQPLYDLPGTSIQTSTGHARDGHEAGAR